MANTMGPEEMLINQIDLLTAEEEKLEKLYQTNSNKNKVKMHLDEVRNKKKPALQAMFYHGSILF
ncbi:hypothetical protein LVD15_23775 [Fulvivirga maritima]|uniref:hypothetical protein n=1 Tax=Fulvivirga maritima TaxID=2904247 RepID=UPI001F232661|nr:hypothetical protein [Fulvivirga maritima]UII26280.1 hypothetical protein LVD15_23775 [Fulvivirga maritima]